MCIFDYTFNLIFRKILKISTNVIPQEEIIQIAKKESNSRGLGWAEPVSVSLGVRSYTIITNRFCRGGNVKLTINAYSGKIESVFIWPR